MVSVGQFCLRVHEMRPTDLVLINHDIYSGLADEGIVNDERARDAGAWFRGAPDTKLSARLDHAGTVYSRQSTAEEGGELPDTENFMNERRRI